MRLLPLLGWAAAAAQAFCSGHQTAYDACATEKCPVEEGKPPIDAEWGEWSEWGDCTCQGIKERHRAVKAHAQFGGKNIAGTSIEATECEIDKAACQESDPLSCQFSAWSLWGKCDCGTLQLYRTRTVLGEAENCGAVCEGALQETKSCPQDGCDTAIDCGLSKWTEWGMCSVSCGGGQSTRSRYVDTPAALGGQKCEAPLFETRACNEQCCDEKQPVDCAWGEWTEWSACSATCAGGEHSRQRVLQYPPRNGGAWCGDADVRQVKGCNQQACDETSPSNGVWDDWGKWTPCTAECGGGFSYRTRRIAKRAENGGSPPQGDFQEYQQCNEEPCENPDAVDCAFSPWSAWGGCSQACNGFKSRFREIATHGRRGGKICAGPLRAAEPCNVDAAACHRHDPKPCEWAPWSAWGKCSVTCDGGQRLRSRSIEKEQEWSGEGCNGPLTELAECGAEPCQERIDQDCEWGDWVEWGDCSQSCDEGVQMRWRGLSKPAQNGGKVCTPGESLQVQPCNAQPCSSTIYCIWSEWGAWGECSHTCGGGERPRQRNLITTTTPPSSGEVMDAMAKFSTWHGGAQGGLLASAGAGAGAAVLSLLALARLGRSARREGDEPLME